MYVEVDQTFALVTTESFLPLSFTSSSIAKWISNKAVKTFDIFSSTNNRPLWKNILSIYEWSPRLQNRREGLLLRNFMYQFWFLCIHNFKCKILNWEIYFNCTYTSKTILSFSYIRTPQRFQQSPNQPQK